MDPFVSGTAGAAPDVDVRRLERDVRALRFTLHLTLVALVILSFSLSGYLLRQVTLLRRQAVIAEQTSQQMAKNSEALGPQVQSFEQRLIEFARTNVDFRARIARYYASPTNAPPPPPGPAPAPGPSAAPPFADRPQ